MKFFHELCQYLRKVTTIEELYLYLVLSTIIVILIFMGIKKVDTLIFRKFFSDRREYVVN